LFCLIVFSIILPIEYPAYEEKIIEIIRLFSKEIDINFNKIGKKSQAHLLAYSFGSKREKYKNNAVIPLKGTEAKLHPESTGIRRRTRPN